VCEEVQQSQYPQ